MTCFEICYNLLAGQSLSSNTILHDSSINFFNIQVKSSQPSLILSLNTATPTGSVALLRADNLLASRRWGGEAKGAHSAQVLREIDESLKDAGVEISQVDLFAAATGPGSFTGLRIGLSVIKAFAATLGRPCVGVSTLYAIAHGASVHEQIIASLPAGRGELFTQRLRVTDSRAVIALDEPTHLKPEALLSNALALRGPILWAGPGAELYQAQISEFAGQHRRDEWIISARQISIAVEVAALAQTLEKENQTVTAEELTALYVRRADARLHMIRLAGS